jgi:hypothetical protein
VKLYTRLAISCDEASALSREDGEADLAIQHIFLYKITSGFITPLWRGHSYSDSNISYTWSSLQRKLVAKEEKWKYWKLKLTQPFQSLLSKMPTSSSFKFPPISNKCCAIATASKTRRNTMKKAWPYSTKTSTSTELKLVISDIQVLYGNEDRYNDKA